MWCAENRPKLKKIRSKLEFKLHLQVFIEFVRKGEMMEAIAYAKRNLAPWAPQHMEELQRVIATIAFQSRLHPCHQQMVCLRAQTSFERYKELFKEDRWEIVIGQYYEALYRLNCLTSQPLLSIHLQAGDQNSTLRDFEIFL